MVNPKNQLVPKFVKVDCFNFVVLAATSSQVIGLLSFQQVWKCVGRTILSVKGQPSDGQDCPSYLAALWWIVAAGIKRVTPADPPRPFQDTANGSVLLDGTDRVVAARRLEPALLSNEGTERPLVHANTADANPRRYPPYEGQDLHHVAPRFLRGARDDG